MRSCLFEYDEEETMRLFREEGKEEGYAEGYAIGFVIGLTRSYLISAAEGIVIPKEKAIKDAEKAIDNFVKFRDKYRP